MRLLSQPHALRHLFAAVLPLGALACGSESTPAALPEAGAPAIASFSQSLCNADGWYHVVDGLQPALPTDYIEFREYGARTQPPAPYLYAGTICKSAADKPKCEARVRDAEAADRGFWDISDAEHRGPPRPSFIIATRGDEVVTVENEQQLKDFLGPIDTLAEAALLLHVRSHEINCSGTISIPVSSRRLEVPTSTGEAVEGGFRLLTYAGLSCGANTHTDAVVTVVGADGTRTTESREILAHGDANCVVGRRPDGLCSATVNGEDLAAFFAEMAHLEAASVEAFAQIEAELRAFGAPAALLERAHEARHDEIRHAEATSAMARRFGGAPLEPRVERAALRTRFQFALDNAIEGCVRETFGALVAHHQAAHAADHDIACMMQEIAHEETRHAALSWAIADWLEPSLTEDQRCSIDRARANAIDALATALERPYADDVVRLTGFPAPATARALLDGLRPHLLAA